MDGHGYHRECGSSLERQLNLNDPYVSCSQQINIYVMQNCHHFIFCSGSFDAL